MTIFSIFKHISYSIEENNALNATIDDYIQEREKVLYFFFLFICWIIVATLQISARWDPVEACRPIIEEAPVFYPTIEVLIIIAIFTFVVAIYSFFILSNLISYFTF